jgi:uncharacterized membrane protein
MEEIRRLLDDLHNDLVALRHELKLTEARLEAKIDSKPSLMAMFTGIVIVVFGMFGVVASTIATLHTVGIIK